MEGKKLQKSVFEPFKIPIEEYEKDMETEKSKGKKKEILDLLTNYNNLRSENEFIKIQYILHKACQKGNLELIKLYLSETIEDDSKSLKFKIDRANHTASLFEVNKDIYIEKLIIPRTIRHESVDYLITCVNISADHRIESIEFDADSAVDTIYGNFFPVILEIKGIFFPSSLKKLKDKWCYYTDHLTKIKISPSNDQFIFKDNNYLLGKSDENNNEFDIILFGRRDIEEISIPSNIKIISSCAFNNCKNLEMVEIPPNSNLQTIGKYAFSTTNIIEIFIPATVTKICSCAFVSCEYLTFVEFAPNSNLKKIGSCAFSSTNIEEIVIPASVLEIGKYSFFDCKSLKKVEIPPNSKLQIIGKNAFYNAEIEDIFIPSTVSIICEEALSYCYLKKVEIQPNSNLQTIGKSAFSDAHITSFFIPSNVSEICEDAFANCFRLQIIEFSEESKLESFPLSAFDKSAKFIIMIPSSNKNLIIANDSKQQ